MVTPADEPRAPTQCPFWATVVIRSEDDGHSWSAPVLCDKITSTEVFILGDPEISGPGDGSRIDGLAFVRIRTDEGYLWNDVGEALRTIEEAAQYDLLFSETPFPVDSLDAYAQLTARTRVPIAVGEHTTTRWEFLQLMDQGGVSVAQPYMTTCGGLTEARRIVELAQPRGALVCPGNWSTHVLGTASLHLAAYSPITPVYESAPADVYWSPLRKALQELAPPVVDGAVAWPSAPGIGFELPADLETHFRKSGRSWQYHEPQE